jgi:hypothetical protein
VNNGIGRCETGLEGNLRAAGDRRNHDIARSVTLAVSDTCSSQATTTFLTLGLQKAKVLCIAE